MYALYSPESRLLEQVRRALRDEQGVATTTWREFESFVPRAHCLVIAARSIERDLRLPLRIAGDPAAPIIVVTSNDVDNAQRALRSGAKHIVWIRDIARELHALVCTVHVRFVLDRAADLLRASALLAPALRAALVFALRAQQPIRSVSQLESLVGHHRKTLWRQWHRVIGTESVLRLEDFLDWVMMVHAAHLKPVTGSWARVALRLGIHEHTLARMMTRLTHMKLRTTRREVVEGRFLDNVVRPLTGP